MYVLNYSLIIIRLININEFGKKKLINIDLVILFLMVYKKVFYILY